MYGKSEQKEYGKCEQTTIEKYARIPDSVLCDLRLSAVLAVYGVLARHAFQGATATIGQRRLAAFLGVHLENVNRGRCLIGLGAWICGGICVMRSVGLLSGHTGSSNFCD